MKRFDVIALLGAALAFLRAPDARANGRFPGADQLVVDPAHPEHLLVRATFGFVQSYDAGKSWRWTCEEIVGTIGTFDPPLASTGDGTLVVTVPFEGVAVSHDQGCSWGRAPAPLEKQLVIDMTLEPNEPSSLLVLTSTNDPDAGTDAGPMFVSRVVETKDNAGTWAQVGMLLPSDFIATTIEVAPSDPNRIYVGGVAGNPPVDAVLRSEDRGMSWVRTMLAAPSAGAGAFVSAVDPHDPDRLWVRVPSAPADAFGMAPTTLRVSTDKAASFTTIAETAGSMFGFALSPEGDMLAFGGPGDGVFVGPANGSAAFGHVATFVNRCLLWTPAGLYVCATEPYDPFTLGLSTDRGASFAPIYQLATTCPEQCPDNSAFATTCRKSWSDPLSGVGWITGATGETCSVPWARIDRPNDGGTDGGVLSDGGDEREAGPETSAPAQGGCGCRIGVDRASAGWRIGAALAALALTRCIRWRRRRFLRCRRGRAPATRRGTRNTSPAWWTVRR
jgi:hypothetical protein